MLEHLLEGHQWDDWGDKLCSSKSQRSGVQDLESRVSQLSVFCRLQG